jgi:uncharacterized protein YjbI with pentapeptide repeats
MNLQEAKFVTSNLRGALMRDNRLRFAIFPDVATEGCEGCPEVP